jgi:catechol 2,3-dioxygenase-like lactoylglutathione lyase family enzyme
MSFIPKPRHTFGRHALAFARGMPPGGVVEDWERFPAMRFVNPIVFVSDMRVSTAFYRDLIGLIVTADHGTIVIFEGHFAIHEAAALTRTVWGAATAVEPGPYGRRNLLLYFEDDDIDARFAAIRDRVELIHPIERQAWGQRVFRFYDPDRHALEIGEPLEQDG